MEKSDGSAGSSSAGMHHKPASRSNLQKVAAVSIFGPGVVSGVRN